MSTKLLRHPRFANGVTKQLRCARQWRTAHATRWSSTEARQWSTPLAKSLAEAITTTGPISIAKYMRECLTSPDGGYYTTQAAEGTDQFGKAGDFVTSPEISQIFGELVGIWIVAEWMAQGRPGSHVELLELGPGRGTLMDDVLRTISKFPSMAAAISHIRLVEASPTLRATQHARLATGTLESTPTGHTAPSKHLPQAHISWTDSLSSVPRSPDATPFLIAHEFFDALPIHAFTSVPPPSPNLTTSASAPPHQQPPSPRSKQNEWRELVVSPTAPPSKLNPPKSPPPDFELSRAKAATPYSRLLPKLSPRYEALLGSANSTIEVSPDARIAVAEIAALIGGTSSAAAAAGGGREGGKNAFVKPRPSGAALVVDYGPAETVPVNTLRGIRQHRIVSPFDMPGRTDLSADVDFGALVETALAASDGVVVHGPVTQGAWLGSMGGAERMDALVRGAADPEVKDRVRKGWERLVDRGPDGMGRVYKCLAIVPDHGGQRMPVGFGGDVAQ